MRFVLLFDQFQAKKTSELVGLNGNPPLLQGTVTGVPPFKFVKVFVGRC